MTTSTITKQRVALVTGANTGIGKAIVEGLLQRDNSLIVLLGARSADKGNQAVNDIKQNLKNASDRLQYIHIDLHDYNTIDKAAEQVKQQYKQLNILVNNAGWASKGSDVNEEIARESIKVNYYGTKYVTDKFLPLMPYPGRIVNVSSTSSAYALNGMNEQHRNKFLDDNLTIQQLEYYLNEFATAVGHNNHQEQGYPNSCYGMSKVGVSMLTRIYSRDYAKNGLTINCGCPGYVATNMSSHKGHRTPSQGAATFIDLALNHEFANTTGQFFYNSKSVSYLNKNM